MHDTQFVTCIECEVRLPRSQTFEVVDGNCCSDECVEKHQLRLDMRHHNAEAKQRCHKRDKRAIFGHSFTR